MKKIQRMASAMKFATLFRNFALIVSVDCNRAYRRKRRKVLSRIISDCFPCSESYLLLKDVKVCTLAILYRKSLISDSIVKFA